MTTVDATEPTVAGVSRSKNPFDWLAAGWRDLVAAPAITLAYGLLFFVTSWIIVGVLFFIGAEGILLPAIAGWLLVGPLLAIGLYHTAQRLAVGKKVSIASVIDIKGSSLQQLGFAGALLMVLLLIWIRAAAILYALFFGMGSFSGFGDLVANLFLTWNGVIMLVIGSLIGGLFAALGFAISAFSIPMLLSRDVDIFTAMARSAATVWKNMGVMIVWGAIIVLMSLAGMLIGFLGMIIVFPLLGYATWHAYAAFFGDDPATKGA